MAAGCQKVEITEAAAIKLARSYVKSFESEEFIRTLHHFDSPVAEKADVEDNRTVLYETVKNDAVSSKWNNLKGKKVWIITYTSDMDPILGPLTIYIDRFSGKIYGSDLRF